MNNTLQVEMNARELELAIRCGRMTLDLLDRLSVILEENVKEKNQDDECRKILGFVVDYIDAKIDDDEAIKQKLIKAGIIDAQKLTEEIDSLETRRH